MNVVCAAAVVAVVCATHPLTTSAQRIIMWHEMMSELSSNNNVEVNVVVMVVVSLKSLMTFLWFFVCLFEYFRLSNRNTWHPNLAEMQCMRTLGNEMNR